MVNIPFTELRPLPSSNGAHQTLIQTPEISSDGSKITIQTNGKSDWWRTPTEWRHSGPVLGMLVPAEKGNSWSVGVSIAGTWVDEDQHFVGLGLGSERMSIYDQAALIVYQSDKEWIKTGIEFMGNKAWKSAVVTNPYSDWSLLPYKPSNPSRPRRFKLNREGSHVRIYIADDDNSGNSGDQEWSMIREVNAFFPASSGPNQEVWVGVMGCSPKGNGTDVRFEHFWIE
ncbi:Protein of unknown function DUF1349 [Phaffia rhodozyma]|uniref:Concanavalin A-like lectin/glucanase, subgroup n=1 Tax=Phaffia rhodozyma TaxID=264483 RepID=A0A0F7SFR5_PHARH|nr:Protein of unknown function DUF1349 [Phaffia rhodozyma]